MVTHRKWYGTWFWNRQFCIISVRPILHYFLQYLNCSLKLTELPFHHKLIHFHIIWWSSRALKNSIFGVKGPPTMSFVRVLTSVHALMCPHVHTSVFLHTMCASGYLRSSMLLTQHSIIQGLLLYIRGVAGLWVGKIKKDNHSAG